MTAKAASAARLRHDAQRLLEYSVDDLSAERGPFKHIEAAESSSQVGMRQKIDADRKQGVLAHPERAQVGLEQCRFPPLAHVKAAAGPYAHGLHVDFQRAVKAVESHQRVAVGAQREGGAHEVKRRFDGAVVQAGFGPKAFEEGRMCKPTGYSSSGLQPIQSVLPHPARPHTRNKQYRWIKEALRRSGSSACEGQSIARQLLFSVDCALPTCLSQRSSGEKNVAMIMKWWRPCHAPEREKTAAVAITNFI